MTCVCGFKLEPTLWKHADCESSPAAVSVSWSNVVVGKEREALDSLIPLSDMMIGEGVWQPWALLAQDFGHQFEDISPYRSYICSLYCTFILFCFPPSVLQKTPYYTSMPCMSFAPSVLPYYLSPSLESVNSFHDPQVYCY